MWRHLLTANLGTGYNSHPESCNIDIAQNLFVGQADGGTIGSSIPPAPQSRSSRRPPSRGTDFIDLAADQCTMHYTSEGSSIKTYNVCTNTQGPDFRRPWAAARVTRTGSGQTAKNWWPVLAGASGQLGRRDPPDLYRLRPHAPSSFLFALNLDPDGTTFWTADSAARRSTAFNIATGAQVTAWNAGKLGGSMAGLAVVGEIVVSQPTPTPRGPDPDADIPVHINPLASNPVPTLQPPAMAILGLLLAALGILLMKRSR